MSSAEAIATPTPPMAVDWVRPSSVQDAILQTIAYVDGYDYPLRPEEVHRYLIGHAASPAEVQAGLQAALRAGRLVRVDSTYMLPGREATADTRRRREETAARLWPEALRYGRRIAALPFVRMVAVTGSLAVNNVNRQADIDFFIITADDHLWVCRAFVIGVVRLAARRGITLCPNYFLSERSLGLTDRNLYTAHEVAQMIPLSGHLHYTALRQVNAWTGDFLPNAGGQPLLPIAGDAGQEPAAPRSQAPLEAVLRSEAGRRLEARLMRDKVAELRREHQAWDESAFTPDCCKGHFHLHKQQALDAYETRRTGVES